MRILGFTFLIAGFVWLAANTIMLGPIERSVVVEVIGKMEGLEASGLSAEEAQNFVRKGVSLFRNRLPSYMLPGSLMLIGGLILGINRSKLEHSGNEQ